MTNEFNLKKLKNKRESPYELSLLDSYNELFCVVVLSNNLNTLVITASTAYSVCSVEFAALRALYDVGGVFKLPNA